MTLLFRIREDAFYLDLNKKCPIFYRFLLKADVGKGVNISVFMERDAKFSRMKHVMNSML